MTILIKKKGKETFIEVGGGIRTMETVRAYVDAGVSRVILGTAAVSDPEFLKEALLKYGEKIAVVCNPHPEERIITLEGESYVLPARSINTITI